MLIGGDLLVLAGVRIYSGDMKGEMFIFRLSVEEKAQLRSAAGLAGMSMAQYLLSRALPERPVERMECMDCERLSRIGGGKCLMCENSIQG